MDGWGVIEVFDAFGGAKITVRGLKRRWLSFSRTLEVVRVFDNLVLFEVFYRVLEVCIAF